MKYFSVCSGIEAASVAWHPLGWQPVGFSEIEPFPSAVLKHHFPDTKNYGDLTKYPEWGIEPGAVDILVGGTPCQSFSVAGLRKGMSDPRGNLALTFLGLADKLKPRWIVWENVPGVLSSNGGRDFGAFLGALEQLGYGFAYRVLDAQHFGVPQRRRRVFVVASLGGWQLAAKILFESDCLRGNPKKGRAKGQGTTASVEDGVGSGLPKTVGTICADTHPGSYSGQDAYTGRLIPAIYQNTVGALCARDYKGVGNQYVQEGKCLPMINQIYEASRRDGIRIYDGASPTLQSFMGTGGNNVPLVNSTYNIQGNMINRSDNAGPQGSGISENNAMFTLTKTDIHAVATSMAVRRLTPMECERLQGFPDNWTRIPWKGKAAEDCPDGPRYKACGNSMAVPVMRWIGERIAQFDK